ncbi:MAG: DMT family transporter [Thiohalophilus sp.]|uniref:DMT family transporter n=1 Tax=Thiohalophilus sp. TaxID=3028392 RepID=UPI00286FF56C|nr:DMT family transporter [Thiohalophilus sp.]MDR9436497.1 DMT family transporter [Thiohalophilus sp.]
MSVPTAYIGVVLIWSTTPLAIKWSGEGPGFLFGVAARMWLGALVCVVLLRVLSRGLPRDRAALKSYLAGGIGVFGAMTSVYWGAQHIPSGLISVLFGLTPIVTGIMAALWLQERALTWHKLGGIILALSGLSVVFARGLNLGEQAGYGIAAIVLAVCLHSLSMVLVKKIDAHLSGLESTSGALLVAAPCYLLVWLLFDGQWPTDIGPRAAAAILYLAVFGSVLGFIMFFYVLKQIDASRVALVTLLTPVLALLFGRLFNQEQIGLELYLGAMLILLGMGLYQWGGLVIRTLRNRAVSEPE